MNPILNIAIQAIRKAGDFLIKEYDFLNMHNIKTIESKNNLLLKTNKKINLLISNIIKKYYPLHAIITSNNYNANYINKQTQWIINPLDSQTNFIKHFPYFASSISVKIKGNIEISVIYDPIHNDLFTAIRGQGTQLNGYRIHNYINTRPTLHNQIITVYSPYYNYNNIILNTLNELYKTQQDRINFRYSGAIILDLGYVAAGRINALIGMNLNNYNLDSGTLLIKEAGGLIFTFNNKHNTHHKKSIIAGNPKLVKTILEKISIIQ